jgi:hypothetical protein
MDTGTLIGIIAGSVAGAAVVMLGGAAALKAARFTSAPLTLRREPIRHV